MYEAWESLQQYIKDKFRNQSETWQRSVLHAFPPDVGRQVAQSVVRSLHDSVINKSSAQCMSNEQEIRWTMEVLCYGLTLPYSRSSDYDDVVKKASVVYCQWLNIMLLTPEKLKEDPSIPRILKDDANFYCRLILLHLFNVFVPRKENRSSISISSSSTSVQKGHHEVSEDSGLRYQLVVCQNVLTKCFEITDKSRIISLETWETILEFLLIVNHVILCESRKFREQVFNRQLSMDESKRPKQGPVLATEAAEAEHWSELCKRVIEALMQTWLLACHSHFPRPSLWKTFAELAKHWRHHEELVIIWGDAVIELTNALLHNTHHTGGRSSSSSRGKLVPSGLSADTIQQTWFRVLHLLGNPSDICHRHRPASYAADTEDQRQLSAIFKHSVSVLAAVVKLFMKHKPNGNSLLHLIGNWLFDCAAEKNEKFIAGRSVACGCLCQIFSFCKPTAFLSIYLCRFYATLSDALVKDLNIAHTQLIATIVLNSQQLLTVGLQGVHILLPDLLEAARFILRNAASDQLPVGAESVVDLHRAAVHLLLSAISLPNHFANTAIVMKNRDYLSLRQDIVNFVLESLVQLRDSNCVQMLLCGLLCIFEDFFSYERLNLMQLSANNFAPSADSNVRMQQDAVIKFFCQSVAAVCKRLNLEPDAGLKLDFDTTMTALDVVSGFAKLAPEALALSNINSSSSSSGSSSSSSDSSCTSPRSCQNLIKSSIRWLCESISNQCARPRQEHSKSLHSQIVGTYECLAHWALNVPQLLQEEDTLLNLLEIVELGLSGAKSKQEETRTEKQRVEAKWRKQRSPHSARLAQAAECLLSLLMSQAGAFPPPVGPQLAHFSFLSEASFPDCAPRYLAIQNSLIVAVLEPKSNGDQTMPHAVVIVRSQFGRQVWLAGMRDTAISAQHQHQHQHTARRPAPDPRLQPHWRSTATAQPAASFPAEPIAQSQVRADTSVPKLTAVTQNSDEVLQLMAQAELAEAQMAESVRQLEAEQSRPPAACTEFQPARMLLQHLGFLDSATSLDASTQEFFDHLAELDSLPVRRLQTAAVYYVPAGASSPEAIVQQQQQQQSSSSSEFAAFCLGLGWRPDDDQLQCLAYWSDALSEIVFHRPSCSRVEQQQAVIAWLQDDNDAAKFPKEALCPNADPLILVSCRDRLVKIVDVQSLTADSKEPASSGFAPPLLRGLVLPLRTSAQLLRQSILNWAARRRLHLATASARVKATTGSPDPVEAFPHALRHRKIQEIVRASATAEGDTLLLMLLRHPDCGIVLSSA